LLPEYGRKRTAEDAIDALAPVEDDLIFNTCFEAGHLRHSAKKPSVEVATNSDEPLRACLFDTY
jgi:hypothetical protein